MWRLSFCKRQWAIAAGGPARHTTARQGFIVTLHTPSGEVGIGEASPLPSHSIETLADAHHALVAWPARFRGSDYATLLQATPSAAVRFAISTAWWRAFAAVQRRAVADVLGQPPRSLARAIVVDDATQAAAATQRGAAEIKIKLQPEAPERLRDIARATMLPLRVDVNQAWPLHDLPALVELCNSLDVATLEEPCSDAHLQDLPIRGRLGFDETFARVAAPHREAWLRALTRPAALILKPTVLGAWEEIIAVANLARALGHNVIVTHALESPVGFAACEEVALACGPGPHGLGPYLTN